MPEDFQRRLSSVEKEISSIQPGDIRVSIIGTIIDRNQEGTQFLVDDGSGKIQVLSEPPQTPGLGKLVRIFGRVIPIDNGFELQGEIFQDMSRLDLALFSKVKGLKM